MEKPAVLALSLALCLMLLVFSASALAASDILPKSIVSSTVKITKAGTLTPTGSVSSASLSLYIAQEGQQSLTVEPNDYVIVTDDNGNKMVKISFKNLNGPQTYSLVQVVKTNSMVLSSDSPLSEDSRYTTETDGAQLTPQIAEAAYPYPKTLKGVAEMASWVNGYMTYDKSLFGANKPSDWVLTNKRGVCVEYSNLLAAMLRSKGIPTRYASGYAFSTQDTKLIGHAWVEILTSSGWVGFDPTWLEGGFIDATHVKTSTSPGGVEKETLSYIGNGNIDWEKDEENVELVDYTTGGAISLSADAPSSLPLRGGGYVRASATFGGCRLFELTASSCADDKGRDLLRMEEGNRNLWGCGSASAIWAFTQSLSGGYTYTCPVLVYDQAGANTSVSISVSSAVQAGPEPRISGPDAAGAGQQFEISASEGSMLFSTQLDGHSGSQWSLSIGRPGTYDFYAYANGKLAHKEVRVSATQDISVSASAPENVTQGEAFVITAAAKNTGPSATLVTLKAGFGNQSGEKQLTIQPGKQSSADFNFTAYDAGETRYSVSATSPGGFAGYSGYVSVTARPSLFGSGGSGSGFLQAIIDAINGLIAAIMGLFGG